MFGQQSRLLLLHNLSNPLVFDSLHLNLKQFLFALFSINAEPLEPQLFDFSFVFCLFGPSFILSHLFQSLIFSKLLHELDFELLFNPFFFDGSLLLEYLIFTHVSLQLFPHQLLLFLFIFYPFSSLDLPLFELKLIPQILLPLFFPSALHLLSLQLFENLFLLLFQLVLEFLLAFRSLLLLLHVL